MSFRFEMSKALHLLSFMLHCMGGKAPLHRICALLYLADLKHLAQYGSPVLGDSYISTKTAIIPLNILGIYKQLKGEGSAGNQGFSFAEYFTIDMDMEIRSLNHYNESEIAPSEALCIFETVRENKQVSNETLAASTRDHAWEHANGNGEVSYDEIAVASGVSPEFRKYILDSCKNELRAFPGRNETGRNGKGRRENGMGTTRLLPQLQPGSLLLHKDEGGDRDCLFVAAGVSSGRYALVSVYDPGKLPASVRQHDFLKDFFSPVSAGAHKETKALADCSRLVSRHFRDIHSWLKKHPECYMGNLSSSETDKILRTIGRMPAIPASIKKEFNFPV